DQKRGEIIGARKAGLSYRKIAELVSCNYNIIENILKQHNSSKMLSDHQESY
ncbi:21148_t:CDS:1, partial [Racocetra persica]